MELFSELFFDNFFARLGECMDERQNDTEQKTAEALQERLLQESDMDKRTLSIQYIDVCRRILLRAEGKAFVTGFMMGLNAGTALNTEE